MSELIVRMIKQHEGSVRDSAGRHALYKCPAGYYTAGYGRNFEGLGLSDDEAEYLLANDIERVRGELSRFVFFPYLDAVRQAVLVDLCFNIGISRLLRFRKMLGALEVYDFEKAADEMRDSRWYTQVGKRAETLVAMMRTGDASHFEG